MSSSCCKRVFVRKLKKKRHSFFTTSITFLGFVVFIDSVHANQSKVEANLEWPMSKILMMCEVFVDWPIQNSFTLISPIARCLKGQVF